jgi:acetyl-CoA carboxylase, biotin carboxylase subunit
MAYFDKVLIANRGEIAVRVARGLKELGISPVAVYSDADREALHVRVCDEAYHIGPSPSAESYLVMERILEVAHQAGCQAIHPGFGFLSENAVFARAVTAAGLTWIGPPPDAIVAMGSKVVARETMIAAGVPVVPGTDAISDAGQALRAAKEIGFPVLVKASAGGGGKGMRRVDDAESFVAAFDGARREASNAFGDDSVFLEKFVVKPKHVEIQLLSDTHGNHFHLLERDCSIQRRHQKVIEEAPCPVLRPEVRARMGEVATRAAAAVDYVGAGTVEFLLDIDQNFYFLEMNTRLQVEHPVTEMITGIDLVEWQVRIAAGEKIDFAQEDVKAHGVSIQCRIYAEDPVMNFMPSPGEIQHLGTPSGPWVRDDSGVYSGAVVPVFYDPMVSKLVVWGKDRPSALRRMKRALGEYVVRGIHTNIAYHHAILGHPTFEAGLHDTQFLTRHHDELVDACQVQDAEVDDIAVAVAAIASMERDQAAAAAQGVGPGGGATGNPWKLQGRFKRLGR